MRFWIADYFMTYFRAAISSIVSQLCLAVAATAAVERAQLIRPSKHCASWQQTVTYPRRRWAYWLHSLQKNALKLFTHLCSISKSVTDRFATWNPAKWHKNKSKYEAKLSKPSNSAPTRRRWQHDRGASSWMCTVLRSSQTNIRTRHAH